MWDLYLTGVILFRAFQKQFSISVGITKLIYLASCHLQIICSCCFLYLLRWLKLISFYLSESPVIPDNFKTFVPLKTLIDTSPVAVTYLLYMVIASFSIFMLIISSKVRSSHLTKRFYVVSGSPWKLVTMESVRGVNVPMYTTLRRTTVVFTMIVESILAGQRYSRPVIGRWDFLFLLVSSFAEAMSTKILWDLEIDN